jgi:hypothetical protein
MKTLLALSVGLAVVSLATGPAPAQQNPPVRTPESPTQFYERYRAAVPNAKSTDDVLAFWTAVVASEFRSAPADQRVTLEEMKRVYARVTGVKIVKEVVTLPDATLSLEGTSPDQKTIQGTVRLAMEKDGWKVSGLETWPPG